MRRAVFATVLIGVAAAAAIVLRQNHQQPTPLADSRIPHLQALLAEQEQESALAVATYRSSITAPIGEITAPLEAIVRQLPGVTQVEVVSVDRPTHCIIHLRDWHFVPKELLAIDLAQARDRVLSQAEIDELYQQHLLEVEIVQSEQMALLRCLIKHHGLKTVLAEGLSPDKLAAYNEQIAGLRRMENDEIPQLRRQLQEIREFIPSATGERKDKAKAIEAELVDLLDQHKHRLLEMGAAGRLLIAGELDAVLPLDDAAALDAAKPVTPSGKVKADNNKVEARHDAQVKLAMKQAPVAVIVLGGAHDLSDSVQRLGQGQCEYIRVTTRRFKEISE